MIDDILDRVQEPILSSTSKQHLKNIIEGVKDASQRDVHLKMIGHYFTKLMVFHRDLEAMESKITNFCDACNAYMVDKIFKYDKSNFRFAIVRQDADGTEHRAIKLRSLSSGEKQIVSLFCHLYLSGKANYFVLIDEPELSLSVTWQRKFLLDIRDGAFCSGLVATTHSPFIYRKPASDVRSWARRVRTVRGLQPMSMLRLHQEALERGSAGYHQFLARYSRTAKVVYGFVEGKDDPCYYRGFIEQLLPDDWDVELWPAGNKMKVYGIYSMIGWNRFPKRRICFFVDRDFLGLISEKSVADCNIYVTDDYSIENSLAKRSTCHRILTEVLGFTSVDHDELARKIRGVFRFRYRHKSPRVVQVQC